MEHHALEKLQPEHKDIVDDSLKHDESTIATGDEVEPQLHWRTWVVFVAIALTQFASVFAATSSAFWYQQVIASLGEPAKALWIPNSALVFSTGLTPLTGLLSMFGAPTRKWMSVVGGLLGSAGLIIVASAQSMTVAIVGMTLFGFHAATYGANAVIIAEIFSHRMRGAAQGYIYAAQALGGLTSLTGGAKLIANSSSGWRWAFYLPGILGFLGAALLAVVYRPRRRADLDELSYTQRLARLDWLGALLLFGGLVPLLIGLTWAGTVYPWKSAAALVPVIVGLVLLVTFGLHQRFMRKDGAMNHKLFSNLNFGLTLVAIFAEGVVYVVLLVFLGQQIALLIDPRPVQYGLHFAVLQLGAACGASGWGYLSQRIRAVKVPIIIGFTIFFGVTVGFSQLRAGSNANTVSYVLCALAGLGLGAPLALLLATAQLAVAPELNGLATYLIIGTRSFGGCIGVAIAFSIFSTKIAALLPSKIAELAVRAGVAPAGLGPLIGAVAMGNGAPLVLPGYTEGQIAAAQKGRLDAFGASFSYVYYSILPWIVVATVAVAFLRSVTASMNAKVDNGVEKQGEGDA